MVFSVMHFYECTESRSESGLDSWSRSKSRSKSVHILVWIQVLVGSRHGLGPILRSGFRSGCMVLSLQYYNLLFCLLILVIWSFDLVWCIHHSASAMQFETAVNKLHVWHCVDWRWLAQGHEAGLQRTCAACARRTYSVGLWTVYEWTGAGALFHSQCKLHSLLMTYVGHIRHYVQCFALFSYFYSPGIFQSS